MNYRTNEQKNNALTITSVPFKTLTGRFDIQSRFNTS